MKLIKIHSSNIVFYVLHDRHARRYMCLVTICMIQHIDNLFLYVMEFGVVGILVFIKLMQVG